MTKYLLNAKKCQTSRRIVCQNLLVPHWLTVSAWTANGRQGAVFIKKRRNTLEKCNVNSLNKFYYIHNIRVTLSDTLLVRLDQ